MRNLRFISGLTLATTLACLLAVDAVAQESQYASDWSVNHDPDWTPFPPDPAPVGAPNNVCTGGTNPSSGWAEFTFPAFSVSDPITGIEVRFKYLSQSGTNGVDLRLSGSVVGSNTLPLQTGDAACANTVWVSAGGASDTWSSGLTAADFNSGNVSVRINQDANTVDIDAVELTVYSGNSAPDCSGATIADQNADASCSATISGSDVTGVTDPDGDALTITVNPTTLSLGGNSVLVSADDGNGGTCQETITVDVVDVTPPSITCPANTSLNADPLSCEATYAGPPASATDNCDATPTVSSTPTLPATLTGPGDHTISYTATDVDGNSSAACDQTVTVVDVTDPVITLNGDNPLTLECSVDTYAEPGATAEDACDGPVSVSTSGVVDETTPGSYTITYSASDAAGNSASEDRTVNVEDTIHPELTLLGDNPMTLECSVDGYVEPGATVTDICDPSPTLDISGSVDETTPGSYPITYVAADASGNDTTATRTVNVVDTIPPDIIVADGPTTLWPPNHAYHSTDLSDIVTAASDICDQTVDADDVQTASVSSDEPEEVPEDDGDGETFDDIVIAGDCRSVDVRSERQGVNNGRVYTINLEVADASGNVGDASYVVEVPHEKKTSAVDDGPAYTVAGCVVAPSTRVALEEKVNEEEVVGMVETAGDAVIGEAAVEVAAEELPDAFSLEQNYPNPFNPITTIRFGVPESSPISLVVYDVTGREVVRLIDGTVAAGVHSVTFNAGGLPSGSYLYRLTTPDGSFTETMLLLE